MRLCGSSYWERELRSEQVQSNQTLLHNPFVLLAGVISHQYHVGPNHLFKDTTNYFCSSQVGEWHGVERDSSGFKNAAGDRWCEEVGSTVGTVHWEGV